MLIWVLLRAKSLRRRREQPDDHCDRETALRYVFLLDLAGVRQ